MAYFLDDNHPDIIVVFEKESAKFPGKYDRVVWSKREKRFIYGSEEEYTMYHGEEEIPIFDTSRGSQELLEDCYRRGLTFSDSLLYDEDNVLYEVSNIYEDREVVFDANEVMNN